MSLIQILKPTRGLTMIELMIVLVILSLLLLASLPSYTRYVQRTYRTEAAELLIAEATRQEKDYLLNHGFTPRPAYNGASGRYRINIEIAANGRGYVLSAIPRGSQAEDVCGTFELDNKGRKRSDGNSQLCWSGRG
jgi:type IV pilus assembly protein PilE